MQLREYIEHASQFESGLSVSERIEKGRKLLFDFKYPIFDEAYRNVFETHFIRHFYMREIGFETEGLFKFQLETWLNIHMPYFNKLFESELIEYDPLINAKMDVSHTKKNDRNQSDKRTGTTAENEEKTIGSTIDQTSHTTGTGSGTTDSDYTNKEDGTKKTTGTRTEDNFDRDIQSDTPDGRLALTANKGTGVIEYASSIKEELENNSETTSQDVTDGKTGSGSEHATSTSKTSTDSTANQTGKETHGGNKNVQLTDNVASVVNDIEDYVQHRTGKIGVQTYSKMIMEFRESLLRVERDIFKEMNQLFMLIY